MKHAARSPDALVTPGLIHARVRTPYILIIVMAWVVLAVITAAMVWGLTKSRQDELNAAELTLQYQTRSLSENISTGLSEAEHRLRLIIAKPYLSRIFDNQFFPAFFDDMANLRIGVHGPMTLRFIDADGNLIATHAEPRFGEGTSLADQPFFRAHSQQFQDFVLVHNAQDDTSGEDTLDISRAVYDDDNAFLGVVQIRKPLRYITHLFSRDDFGGYESVIFFDAEREILATWPPKPAGQAGVKGEWVFPFSALEDLASTSERFENRGSFDAMAASYKLAGYPLYIATARTYDDVLINWVEERNAAILILLSLLVSVSVFSVFIFAFMRQAVARDLAIRTFHAAVDQSTVSIVLTDTCGTIEYVNPHFTRATGYESWEAIGQNPRILKSDETPPELHAQLWNHIANGETWQGEFCNRRKDGSIYWESAIISPIRDEDGDIVNYISVQDDITERKEAEDLIRRQSQRLNAIIWGTNVGTWEWNVITDETRFNEQWAGICGYTLAELEPLSFETWERLVHPIDLNKAREQLRLHFAGEVDFYECEIRMHHKDGHWVWVLARGRVSEWTEDGKPLLMAGTHADITARKEAEDNLRQSEIRFRRLVEQTQQAYFLYSHNPDGVFTYVSPSIETVLGYSPVDFLTHYTNYLTDSAINEAAQKMTEQGLQGLETPPYDIEILHKNGERRILEVSESPVFDANGRLEAIEGIAHDITPQRDAEREVSERNAELQDTVIELRSSRAELERQATYLADLAETKAQLSDQLSYELGVKDRFFSIIAHDLKSPFTALLGMSQMMVVSSHKWSKEQLVDYAASVNDAGNRVFELLQTLLEWARLQMDGGAIQPADLALHDVVQDCINLEMPMALDKNIEIKNDVPASRAYADENMVRTILRNLITNAVKFTENGGQIRLGAIADGDMVALSVSDDGVGMTREQIDTVFRLDHKTTTPGTAGEAGTGLGLPLCKEMVELNGGQIWIESTPKNGTTFHFTLPRLRPATQDEV